MENGIYIKGEILNATKGEASRKDGKFYPKVYMLLGENDEPFELGVDDAGLAIFQGFKKMSEVTVHCQYIARIGRLVFVNVVEPVARPAVVNGASVSQPVPKAS